MDAQTHGITDDGSTDSSWMEALPGEVLAIDADSENAAGIVETGSTPASELGMSEGSWEMPACPSSGPPSISFSKSSNISVGSDAPRSGQAPEDTSWMESELNASPVSMSQESNPDDLSDSFSEKCFKCGRGRHPGKRDVRKREIQAIKHETDHVNRRLLRKRAKDLAKILSAKDMARKERAATRYRVEERRFKRRYRDWCCFGETRTRRNRKTVGVAHGCGYVRALRTVPSLLGEKNLAQPSSCASFMTPPGPEASAKMTPKKESRRSPAKRFMEIYARAAYWRTVALLHDGFGYEYPDETPDTFTLKLRLLKAKAAKALDTILALKSRRTASRKFTTIYRRTTFSAARFVQAVPSRKSRSGRLQAKEARKNDAKQWMRKASRGASPDTEVSTIVAKCRLAESRKVASQARSQMRSAQRDAKHFGFDSACCKQPSLTQSKSPKIMSKFLSNRMIKDFLRSGFEKLSPNHVQFQKSLGDNSKANEVLEGLDTTRPGEPLVADVVAHLIPVWECFDQFQFVNLPDTDGKVLIPSPPSKKPYQVASKTTFLDRLHKRTQNILHDIDWSNLRIIGGMMLACLVADEEDFAKNFAETDVDIYIVGLSGLSFKERVASLVEELYRSANASGVRAVVLRTPCTITLSLCGPGGERLPNVQIVMAPFENTRHLLFTTDIDCTGFGFDGDRLFATPWACQAIAHRRIIARPEKYEIRGEWSTESRLMKYAMRGFRVVDLGLDPAIEVPNHRAIKSIAEDASAMLREKALCESKDMMPLEAIVRKFERMTRATGVIGAHLLLLALQNQGLRELLLFDVPLLPAGMGNERRLAMLSKCELSLPLKDDGYGHFLTSTRKHFKKPRKLQVLYSEKTRGDLKDIVKKAAVERDPDSISEVRHWYTGLVEKSA